MTSEIEPSILERPVKVILLGDSNVGKSHIGAFINQDSLLGIRPTVGTQFFIKDISFKSFGLVNLKIWDTAGQQAYRSIAFSHFKGAELGIVVYDVTNQKSFLSLAYWIKEFKDKADSNAKLIVFGNKSDKSSNKQELIKKWEIFAQKEQNRLIRSIVLGHFLTSVYNDEGNRQIKKGLDVLVENFLKNSTSNNQPQNNKNKNEILIKSRPQEKTQRGRCFC